MRIVTQYSYGGATLEHRFIGGDEIALYEAEHKLNEALELAATELGKVLKHEKADYWTKTIPSTLYSLLDGWDKKSVAVVIKYMYEQLDLGKD